MSRVAGGVVVALLLGCSVNVDDMRGLPDACDVRGQCAEGYTCEEARCVLMAGAACEETGPAVACEQRQGVCASAARACVGGRVEEQCTAASYGPAYESRESRCDGVDNDCDGIADAEVWTLGDAGSLFALQLVRPSEGRAAVSLQLTLEASRRWSVRYDMLGEDFGLAGEPLNLQGPVESDDGVLIRTSARPSEVVVVWHTVPQAGAGVTRVARISHPAGTRPVLAAGPIELAAPPEALGAPELALAADGSRILLAWATAAGVHLQQLSPGLTALEEPVVLTPSPSAPRGPHMALLDVAPRGASGFLVAWAASAPSAPTVHLQTFPGTEARTLAVAGELTDLRLLRAPDGLGTRPAWVQRSAAGDSTVEWVEPFGTAAPGRALELPGVVLDRLDAVLAPGGALLLTYPRGALGDMDVVLRRVSPAGPVHEQLLASHVSNWNTQLAAAEADGRLLATAFGGLGESSGNARPLVLRTCALP